MPADERVALCQRLINEEHKELGEAIATDDPVLIAGELVDLIYVSVFTALEYGIPLDKVWNEIQRANMDKRWPDGHFHLNEFGKVIKPEGWKKADIAKVLDL